MAISTVSAPLRLGTASEWSASTLVLADGELAFDTTNNVMKIGDGTSLFSALGAGSTNEVVNGGNSSTAHTISPAALGQAYNLTLTGTPVVMTFPTASTGARFRLRAIQDGTGTRLITWPGTVKWPSGTAPTLTTTASRSDDFEFYCYDGTNWHGRTLGLNFNP